MRTLFPLFTFHVSYIHDEIQFPPASIFVPETSISFAIIIAMGPSIVHAWCYYYTGKSCVLCTAFYNVNFWWNTNIFMKQMHVFTSTPSINRLLLFYSLNFSSYFRFPFRSHSIFECEKTQTISLSIVQRTKHFQTRFQWNLWLVEFWPFNYLVCVELFIIL